jgi:hypothetical protein
MLVIKNRAHMGFNILLSLSFSTVGTVNQVMLDLISDSRRGAVIASFVRVYITVGPVIHVATSVLQLKIQYLHLVFSQLP